MTKYTQEDLERASTWLYDNQPQALTRDLAQLIADVRREAYERAAPATAAPDVCRGQRFGGAPCGGCERCMEEQAAPRDQAQLIADGAAYARKELAKRLRALRSEVLEINAADQGIVLWDAIGHIVREIESE